MAGHVASEGEKLCGPNGRVSGLLTMEDCAGGSEATQDASTHFRRWQGTKGSLLSYVPPGSDKNKVIVWWARGWAGRDEEKQVGNSRGCNGGKRRINTDSARWDAGLRRE